MANDRKNRGELDRSRINLNEDYEVRYWCKELGITRDELQHLIARHGNGVDIIRMILNGQS